MSASTQRRSIWSSLFCCCASSPAAAEPDTEAKPVENDNAAMQRGGWTPSSRGKDSQSSSGSSQRINPSSTPLNNRSRAQSQADGTAPQESWNKGELPEDNRRTERKASRSKSKNGSKEVRAPSQSPRNAPQSAAVVAPQEDNAEDDELAGMVTQVSKGSDGTVQLNGNRRVRQVRQKSNQQMNQAQGLDFTIYGHPRYGIKKFLLPPLPEKRKHLKTLVLDLDETLIHSSFQKVKDADFTVWLQIKKRYKVWVRKRPRVDEFMKYCCSKFDVVIFTASLPTYAHPVIDALDPDGTVASRLFRCHCVRYYGNYVKDLRYLGRGNQNIIIIDNSPFSYMFQPDNAIPITSWFEEKDDDCLMELVPLLDKLAVCDDVVPMLRKQQFQFPKAFFDFFNYIRRKGAPR